MGYPIQSEPTDRAQAEKARAAGWKVDHPARTRHPAAGASTLPSEPHWVMLVTRSLDNPDEPPERKRVNYNNPQSRAAAQRYMTWCLFNRRSFTVAAEVEE